MFSKLFCLGVYVKIDCLPKASPLRLILAYEALRIFCFFVYCETVKEEEREEREELNASHKNAMDVEKLS